jgi:putative pyruvate formate lyase activating enzyme
VAGVSDPSAAYYSRCLLCPRACGVDRLAERPATGGPAGEREERSGGRGFCREGVAVRAAWAGLHFGEEPPLTGSGGSGTIFFTGCTLKCRYCQNDQLSRSLVGRELSAGELAQLMLALQAAGAANINLVTGSHFAPGIAAAAELARGLGLAIPLLWNSSGYESRFTLELLAPWIEAWLPDCKTLDPELSRRLMGAPDYPEVVREALRFMVEARSLRFEGERLRQGVIVRHLVLPGYPESSRGVLAWFREHLYGRALLSVMVQYTPNPRQSGPERRVSDAEYEQILGWLEELGIEEGFIQEPESGSEWLPDFSRRNPFPEGQARPVWHYADGPVG